MKVETDQKVVGKVVAIDPGGTVGVTVAEMYPKDSVGATTILYNAYTLAWPREAHHLGHIITEARVVVCEDWRLRAGKAKALVGRVLEGDRCAGFIEGLCTWHRIELCWQQPSEMFNFRDNIETTIKAIDEDWPKSDHAQDALAHLIVWLMKGKRSD